jgi:hypothetical protein
MIFNYDYKTMQNRVCLTEDEKMSQRLLWHYGFTALKHYGFAALDCKTA